MPTLGVCLGHQALVQAWGGKVIQHEPVHGKTTQIEHDGRTIFRGPARAARGRPLPLAGRRSRPARRARAQRRSAASVVMAVRHRELPAEGVQFHPESVLTEQGRELLANFLDARAMSRAPRSADALDRRARARGATSACERRRRGARRRSWPATRPRSRSPAFLIALRTKGETVRGARRAWRGRCASLAARVDVDARRPARHRRHRRRPADVQRLDDGRADRGRRGLRGRQARQPLGDRPVGLGRRARGARRAHRPRARRRSRAASRRSGSASCSRPPTTRRRAT